MPALARIHPESPAEGAPYTLRPRLELLPPPAPETLSDLRRPAEGLGESGVHPRAVVAVLCLYAVLLLAFWAFFATPETALTLLVITVLGVVYFGLLGGGLLLADSPSPGERRRDFADFLQGRVAIATGWIRGRDALVQMTALPLALLAGAIVFGLIWRMTAG
jgi:hypothetical protein